MLTPNHERLTNWLALWRAPGVGPATFFKLLACFPDLSELFPIKQNQLLEQGFSQRLVDALSYIDWDGVTADLKWAEQTQCAIITIQDPHYPYLLRQIKDAPPLLFVQGDIQVLNSIQLAIIGSRNASPMGNDTAQHFAGYLAQAGITITSGLAQGIDAASHAGALAQSNGKTIAVMGTGPDSIYPTRHRALAQRIKAQGALVTEFPTGAGPKPAHFPRRNRIISGLAAGVLVVEAAIASGSLITARLAAEQGREVFAIPGAIHHPLAKGCHALIKQGAKLVESAADIITELGSLITVVAEQRQEAIEKTAASFDPQTAALINCVGAEPTSIDTIVERSGLTVAEVSSMLLSLELESKIAAVPGGYMRTQYFSDIIA